jgi:hypothetical protein
MDIHAFDSTHGALGGMPWPADMFPRDIAESVRVRDWMWKRLEAHSVFLEEKVADPNVAFVA